MAVGAMGDIDRTDSPQGNDGGTPRVLLADHSPTRHAVAAALDGSAEIVAEAGDAAGAIAAAEDQQPDVCLIGAELPGGTIEAVRGIGTVSPKSAVVVLAAKSDVEAFLAAVRAGALGYIPADVGAESLRRVVRAAAAQEAAVQRSMVIQLMIELREGGAVHAGRLTAREAQVLGMLRRGQTTRAIAERLEISPVTVRRHISELVHKLEVKDRSALLGASLTAAGLGEAG